MQGISKTRFTAYLECPRLGYFACYPGRYAPLKDPYDWATRQRIETGLRAGHLAREAFPDGILIGHDQDMGSALAETSVALADDRCLHVFEATFAEDGLLARADVLHKVSDRVVDLIEVKATNSVKSEHIADVAFQLHVLERSGLEVRSCSLMHFDAEYLYRGGVHDPREIFTVEDVTEKARRWQRDELEKALYALRRGLDVAEPPRTRIKNSCRACPYYRQVCALDAPRLPICELGGNHRRLFAALEEAGIASLTEVPRDFPGLAPEHLLVLEAIETDGLVLDIACACELLQDLEFPLWFVDFETYSAGFPIFEGTRPWQQIPFQWSLHVLDEPDGEPQHHDFLAAGSEDPRRGFAESLLAATGDAGSLVVYNKSMESARLRELARDFSDLASGLLALESRVFDLLPVVRRSCYHPSMNGSASLKKVTPVLAPHLDYGALDVHAGMEAMEIYERLLDPDVAESGKQTMRRGLRQYCGIDTLAMVDIYKRLMREMGP